VVDAENALHCSEYCSQPIQPTYSEQIGLD